MADFEIYCGISIEDKCTRQRHPLTDVMAAKKMVDSGKGKTYTNSPDFIQTIKYYSEHKGLTVEFFLDGVSTGSEIEPIFEDFNKSLEFLDKLIIE